MVRAANHIIALDFEGIRTHVERHFEISVHGFMCSEGPRLRHIPCGRMRSWSIQHGVSVDRVSTRQDGLGVDKTNVLDDSASTCLT